VKDWNLLTIIQILWTSDETNKIVITEVLFITTKTDNTTNNPINHIILKFTNKIINPIFWTVRNAISSILLIQLIISTPQDMKGGSANLNSKTVTLIILIFIITE